MKQLIENWREHLNLRDEYEARLREHPFASVIPVRPSKAKYGSVAARLLGRAFEDDDEDMAA